MTREWLHELPPHERELLELKPPETNGSYLGAALLGLWLGGEVPADITEDQRSWSDLPIEEQRRLQPLARRFSELNKRYIEAMSNKEAGQIALEAIDLFGPGKLPFHSFASLWDDIRPNPLDRSK